MAAKHEARYPHTNQQRKSQHKQIPDRSKLSALLHIPKQQSLEFQLLSLLTTCVFTFTQGNTITGLRRSGMLYLLYTGMSPVSVSSHTLVLSSDNAIITVDTVSDARAVNDSVTGCLSFCSYIPLGLSVSVPAHVILATNP